MYRLRRILEGVLGGLGVPDPIRLDVARLQPRLLPCKIKSDNLPRLFDDFKVADALLEDGFLSTHIKRCSE